MELGVGSVEENHSPLGEQARIEAGIGRAERFAGAVGLAQKAGRVGFSQQSCGLFDGGENFVTEADGAHRSSGDIVAGGGYSLQRAIGSGKGDVIYFGEIVVGSGQPENGDGIDSGFGGFFGELHGGQRFVDGEHGAAEETDLLAGYGGGGAFAETLDVGESLRRGVP